MSDERNRPNLSIDKCPVHGYWAISINEEAVDGSGIGTRVTPGKCCGMWSSVRNWKLSSAEWEALEKEAKFAAKLARTIEQR